MEARSRPSSAPVLPHTFTLKRTHSATRHFNSPSSSSDFNIAVHNTLSPTRATGTSSYSSTSATTSSSIKFSVETSASQVQSPRRPPKGGASMKSIPCAPPNKTCMCSVTSHPGSFHCSVHRNTNNSPSSTTHSQLNTRRSAMLNSLVRIGGVEGEWVRRALIRPSSHRMRRRTSFEPRPSRLRYMSRAQDVSRGSGSSPFLDSDH